MGIKVVTCCKELLLTGPSRKGVFIFFQATVQSNITLSSSFDFGFDGLLLGLQHFSNDLLLLNEEGAHNPV